MTSLNKQSTEQNKEILNLLAIADKVGIDNSPILLNKDIKNCNNYKLLNLKSEADVQKSFKRCFEAYMMSFQAQYKLPYCLGEFIKIDNGDSIHSSNQLERLKLIKMAKKKESLGLRKGFFDVELIVTNLERTKEKTIYVEVKKISSPCEIKISNEQLFWLNRYKQLNREAYITNNPLFFEKHILLDRIQNFILGK